MAVSGFCSLPLAAGPSQCTGNMRTHAVVGWVTIRLNCTLTCYFANLCVYSCMHVCMYVCMCVCVCVCVCACLLFCVCVCMCVCVRECVCVCVLFPPSSLTTPPLFLSTTPHPQVFFISARVHPGETPASHVCNGMINFLLNHRVRTHTHACTHT